MNSTTTVIAVLIIAVFSAIIIAMMVSQARHKALEAKNHRSRTLAMQKKRLNNLLRSLPPSYLSSELRDFLYQAILQNLKSQAALLPEKNELINDEIAELAAERERIKTHPIKGQTTLHSADQSSVYRGLLKSLYQFVRGNYQTGRLNKSHAEKMLKQIDVKLDETAVEFFDLSAKSFMDQNKYREAKNAYQKALSTIDESKHPEQFQQQSLVIRNSLEKLIEDWRSSREDFSKRNSEKLADQVGNMVTEEDSWKKKQSYD
jgi:tetratricopeptide (TPR) repeat protein